MKQIKYVTKNVICIWSDKATNKIDEKLAPNLKYINSVVLTEFYRYDINELHDFNSFKEEIEPYRNV